AHERFGTLEYTKRMKDTTTQVRLRLDRFIGEIDKEGTAKAHLISVLGGDSDVGAIWAAVNEQSSLVVQGPAISWLTATRAEPAQRARTAPGGGMLSSPSKGHQEDVSEVDRKGAERRSDRISGKEWAGWLEHTEQVVPTP